MDQPPPPPPHQPSAAPAESATPQRAPAAPPAPVPSPEAPLRHQPSLFHAVWQRAADAMVLSDADGIVIAANPAYVRLYGYGHDAVVGHSFALIFPPAQRAWARAHYQQVFASASSVLAFESVIRRADGTERVVESRIEFLLSDGQRVAMLSTIRDITDRTQAAHEREALLHAAEQAQQAQQAQTAALAHTNALLAATSAQYQQAADAARQARDELQLLLAIANDIVTLHDLEALLDRILDHLARVLDYNSAYIHTLDGTILTVRAFRTRLAFPDLRGRTFQLSSLPALARLVTTQEPILVDDVQRDTALRSSTETAIGHRVTNRAWMAVPLTVDGRTIGILSLLHQVAGWYRQPDLERLQSFATQVTIAIHNLWLTEREQQAAVLDERHRLARELHDAVTQTVFSASLIAEALPTTWQDAPPIARTGVAQLHQLTRTALAELRSLLVELRPAALTERPLGELLHALCTATSGRSQVPVVLDARGDGVLRPEVQLALYRIAQEALTNVVKHAEASRVRVTLACRPAAVELVVADDGRGFDAAQVAPDGFGLQGMRERAAQIGATLHITSQRHTGTRVAVAWRPRPAVAAPDA